MSTSISATNELNALGQWVGYPVSDWQGAKRPAHQVIQGKYCRLEPLDADQHGADLFAAFARDTHGSLWTYLPTGPFASADEYIQWIRDFAAGQDPLFFAIIDAASDKPVGVCSYLRIDPAAGSIEIGHICYSDLLSRTPAATEAMYLLMREAFALGYRRYEWKCNALNQPSRIAAQRLGFSYEGVFRQAMVVKGHNRDTAWYGMTDQDWPAIRAALEFWLADSNFDGDGQQRQGLSKLTAPLLVKRG